MVTTPDGTEKGVIHYALDVEIFDAGGDPVGADIVRSQTVSTYGVDRTASLDVEHVRAVNGDLTCVGQTVLKIVDFDVTVDQQTLHCD